MSKNDLTQSELKKRLHYEPETGVFTRILAIKGNAAGTISGGIATSGYIQIRLLGFRYYAHRLAFLYMTGAFPPNETDHKNRVRDDNRWSNLRHATALQNRNNRGKIGMYGNNTSGVKGVHYCKSRGKWRASISINKKRVTIGHFADLERAARARKRAETENGN